MMGLFDSLPEGGQGYLLGSLDGLRRMWNEAPENAAQMLRSGVGNTLDRYADAVYGRKPDGAVSMNDADQWTDAQGNPIQNPQAGTVKGSILPLEKSADGSVNWSTPLLFDALPALGMGGGAGPAAPGKLGVYAGLDALGMNFSALDKAMQMEKSGQEWGDIYKDTGLFRGVDGQWRHEIPDQPAVYRPGRAALEITRQDPTANPWQTGFTAPLPKILDHPKLFSSIPALKDFTVTVDPALRGTTTQGFYDLKKGIHLSPDIAGMLSTGKSILMHEVQHGIQDLHGFPQGTNPAYMAHIWPQRQAIIEAQMLQNLVDQGVRGEDLATEFAQRTGRVPRDDALDLIHRKTRDELMRMPSTPFHAYQANAGEVEARDVQNRVFQHPDLLDQILPYSTTRIPMNKFLLPGRDY